MSVGVLAERSEHQPRLTRRLGGSGHVRSGVACGAARQSGSAVHHAVRKLCASPGLIAASGTRQSVYARHIRGIVFGGMDGILTTFALLAAAEGTSQTSSSLTLVIGFSTVLADALSMAAGEYLSSKAENELAGSQPDPSEPGPLEKGGAMFLAFTLFGSMPLIGYVISALASRSAGLAARSPSSFAISIVITACTLFGLGTLKSQFGAGIWWAAGLEVTGIGSVAASVAYFTAMLIDKVVGA